MLPIAQDDLRQRRALKVMLPWLQHHLAETITALGTDYWDYGLDHNRHVLTKFAEYSYNQGLAKKLRAPEDIVLPQAADGFRL